MSDPPPNQSQKPDWWLQSERIKQRLDLPPYEPPRFSDGTYKHQIVEQLEKKHNCEIRFIGNNTEYPDDWEVWINNETVFKISRRRDHNGNTVYLMTPDRFRQKIQNCIDEATEK
jgi:hypothetical protein